MIVSAHRTPERLFSYAKTAEKKGIKIIIAGGCGFVGSSLAHHFIHKYSKSKIYILDNLMRNGSEINLYRLKNERVVFIEGDLSQKKFFDQLIFFCFLYLN